MVWVEGLPELEIRISDSLFRRNIFFYCREWNIGWLQMCESENIYLVIAIHENIVRLPEFEIYMHRLYIYIFSTNFLVLLVIND